MYAFDRLRTIAESATGYVGSSNFEDEMPEIGLDEAASYLPVVCLECQNEFINLTREGNASMVEAAASAIEYGTAFDADALAEASLEGIKQKIASTFERIRKFIQSVIAKIRTTIDSLVKSGEQLWAKYGNSDALNKDFGGLTYEGWSFPGTKILDAANRCKITNLLNTAFGERLPSPDKFEKQVSGMAAALTRGGAANKNESLKNMSQSERDKNLAQALTGVKGLGDNWRDDLTKQVWGEKKTMKYGEAGFSKDAIGNLLKNAGANLKSIETEYVNLEKEVGDLQKQCQASADRAAAALGKAKKDGADEKTTSNLGLVSDYYGNYASYVHEAVSVISYVKQVAIRFQKERYAQAKGMLGKMLSYKPGKAGKEEDKNKNEDYEGDVDAAILEFEL